MVKLIAVHIPLLVAPRHNVASGTGILDAYLVCARRYSSTHLTTLSTAIDILHDPFPFTVKNQANGYWVYNARVTSFTLTGRRVV